MTTLLRRMRERFRPPRTLAFTRAGTFLVLMAFGIGFGAINTGNNLLFLLLGTMLALIVASGFLSEAVLRGLRVRRTLPSRAFADTPATGEFVVDNPKRWPSLSVEIAEMDAQCTVGPLQGREVGTRERPWWKFWKRRIPGDDVPHDLRTVASGYCVRIESDDARTLTVGYEFPARGVYRLTGLRLTTRFPFSLFEKSREEPKEATVTVYPPPREPGPWATRLRGAFGTDASDDPGRGDEYYGLREYRPGEDKRLIHWKQSASRGELVVKEHEERTSRAVRIHLYNATARDAAVGEGERDRFERGLERIAGLVEALGTRDWELELETLDDGPASSTAGPDAMMRILAATELHSGLPETGFEREPDPRRGDVLVALPPAIDRIEGDWDLVLPLEDVD